jgi:CheY-like chemotaxis protein
MQRILVIDDDDLSRELLTMLLESDGYAVHSAASGDEALGNHAPTDIILTDMQMPGLCGNALAERLRSLYGKGVSIIAMSGSEVSPSERALYDGFLLKPFAVADLEALLSNGTFHAKADGTTVLDEVTYTRLLSVMPPDQIAEMFAFCLADADKRIARMTYAIEAKDDALYRREAHTIKGGCGMLGALELKAIAGTMEAGGIEADGRNDGSELGTLRDQFMDAVARLQRILESHPR